MNDPELEAQIRDRLQRAAAHTEPPGAAPDVQQAIGQSTPRRTPRRSVWLVGVAATAVVAVIAAVAVLRDVSGEIVSTEDERPVATDERPDADTASSSTPPDSPELAPGSSRLPSESADGRVFPVSVWTGSELIIWGGESESETTWVNDGIAFDPVEDTGRLLSESPLSPRSEHAAVWTGEEVLICCGRAPAGDGRRAAAYDPADDSWRELADPPFDADFAASVWTGTEMIVTGGSDHIGAAAYSPDDDAWRTLADPPATIERLADIAWTGEQIIVWPREFTTAPGLVYNVADNAWTELPPVPTEFDPARGSMIWTGTEIVVWGAPATGEGDAVGARIGLDEGSWRPITADPLPPYDRWNGSEGSSSAVWTGTEMLVWAGYIGADIDATSTPIIAYNPEFDSWRRLPDSQTTAYHPRMHWTGEVALVLANPLIHLDPRAQSATEPSNEDPARTTDLADGWDLLGTIELTDATLVAVADDTVIVGSRVGLVAIDDDGTVRNGKPGPLTSDECCGPPYVGVATNDAVVALSDRAGPTAVLDPETLSWREMAAPPVQGELRDAVWTGSEVVAVYTVGALNDPAANDWSTLVLAFDPVEERWRELPELPQPINRGGVSTLDDRIVVSGTIQAFGNNIVGDREPYVFELVDGQWVEIGRPPIDGQAAVAVPIPRGHLAWNYDLRAAVSTGGGWAPVGDLPGPSGECTPDGYWTIAGVVADGCGGLAVYEEASATWQHIAVTDVPDLLQTLAVVSDRIVAVTVEGNQIGVYEYRLDAP